MSALDMSVLCKDWTPTVTDRETVASMPLDKELTLSVSLRAHGGRGRVRAFPFGVEIGDARTLILSAFVDDVTLFELRFWDGKLVLQAGTAEAQEDGDLSVYGGDNFTFQVSFNPQRGGLAIVASWLTIEGRWTQQFVANISNLKLPPARYYTLRLGAPKHFVDLSLLGWQVNATFDLAAPLSPPVPTVEMLLDEARKLWPPDEQDDSQEEMLADLFLGYNPATERVASREPGRLVLEPISTDAQTSGTASAIVKEAPLDTLRLALQSIDSWRKVAEGALHELEGGAR